MQEFTVGTDTQYQQLRDSLDDGMCHVYRCVLPNCCTPNTARLGFEKEEGDTYALFIDKGITCRGQVPGLFRDWLEAGTLRFLDFTDMKEFLRELKSLF